VKTLLPLAASFLISDVADRNDCLDATLRQSAV
jgi:hypothetical protein